MKIKTSELSGVQLDWAVLHAMGETCALNKRRFKQGSLALVGEGAIGAHWNYNGLWAPSTYWAQGGPIIERVGIQLVPGKTRWFANDGMTGETALIAAMRCYVASKLGDEVEIPEELRS